MTRRGNRESWLPGHPNSKGYWEASVWMGYKPNGKPDRRHVERKTRAARNKRVRELERQRDEGIRRPSRLPAVEQVLTRHLIVVLPLQRRAPRTLDDYWSKCRNDIFPRWGAVRIDQLTPEMIDDGYAAMLAAGHAAGHVRKVHAILSSALEIETARGNIPRNPCDLAHKPPLRVAEKPSLSGDQARAVLAAIAGRRDAARWWVGLACGLRQGEALGLRWEYVDLDGGELRVWYQLQRLTWRHGCEPPCSGKRGADCPARKGGGLVLREIKERRLKPVALPPEVAELLRAHKAAQNAERLAAGPLWADGGFVFAQPDGRPVDPRADWEQWRDILAAAGIPHGGVHLMRHSAATIALHEGVALAAIKEQLGHSTVAVTEVYTHVSSAMAHAAAATMGRVLSGPTATKNVPKRGRKDR
jgi:integrase